MPNLRKFEWEAVAGLLAAVVALILHFLHVCDAGILRAITLVLVALLFLRDFHNEDRWKQLGATTKQSVHLLEELGAATPRSEVDLIGPSRLRCATAQFAGKAEALVSVWGAPFMAVHHERRIPGSITHVREHSELIGRFREVERAWRGA